MPGFERRQPSFDLAELVGRKIGDARERCERDGFHVQVVDLDRHPAVTLEWRPDRIRLAARRGVVEDCHQG
ncbi:hypothetical protein [Amycolatopsis rifamycinica]|uniref:Proteinase inhibitor I78 n=1 Tax=Amycolatopsis rifamycinica TaxID=287986 RepID=A0A066U649_9PSEU|nr:hypothetical protein [Amycolatopsis rifamycinica]KDN21332.1 hypothetical protein DV20_15695 [Amycolatopsis rifamycinica]